MVPPHATDAERQLATQLAMLNATLESTPDGVLVVDTNGKAILSNERFAQLWRIPRELHESGDDTRMLQHVLEQMLDPEEFLNRVQELYASDGESLQDCLYFRDGRVFERFTQPVRTGQKIIGRIWVFRDVTAQRKAELARLELEEQLRQSQKMEAIGKLAGGVAHDFNNLLTVIMGYSRLMLAKVGERDALRANVEEIRKAGERAAGLTRQLLAFSRKQLMAPRVFELNVTVQNMERMLRHVIGEDIELVTVLGEDAGSILADPGQIEQVLLNLVVNARDAMPSGGQLRIETRTVQRPAGPSGALPGHAAGEWVEFAVIDSGCGMNAATRERIFEPFFTTKDSGRGTGLGLSTVYGIIAQSEGLIEVDSEEGRGSAFRVLLPRAEAFSRTAEAPLKLARADTGTETILVVEDEPQVRNLAIQVLAAAGYSLLEAGTPAEALECCRRHPGTIDLMLSDVIMPQLNGRELYEHVRGLRPGMKVLFMSGYTGTAIEESASAHAGPPYLQKPFTPELLCSWVRDALDGERATNPGLSRAA